MIALRPIHGIFGLVKISIKEGRKIPEQILKFLDVESMIKDGTIKDESIKEEEKQTKEKMIPMSQRMSK